MKHMMEILSQGIAASEMGKLCVSLLTFGGLFLYLSEVVCTLEFSTIASLHVALAEPQL